MNLVEAIPQKKLRGTRASTHIDMIRGMAAVAVLYSHARVLLMESVTSETRVTFKILYLLSGYGHSAVMVFFVLSGYLVGGGVVQSTATHRWCWGDYLLARGTRLYLVLVPALILTVVWDRVGIETVVARLANDDTARAIITMEQVVANSSTISFLGNLAFLQTIAVPPYGSNAPLWSLANEMWYYLIFPCLWLITRTGQTMTRRAVYSILALAMLAFVGFNIVSLFPVWLLGVGVALLPRIQWLESRWAFQVAGSPLIVTLGLIGLGRIPHGYIAQYAVAVTYTLFLVALLQRREASQPSWYTRTAAVLAGCSYTLYLTHLPVLVCLRAFLTYEKPWNSDLLHWSILMMICVGCIAYAYLLSLATEAKTDQVRRWLAGRPLPISPAVQETTKSL